MPDRDITILRKQILFCETYLENHTDPSDPKNSKEVRDYLEEQLAIARNLLSAKVDVHHGVARIYAED